MKHSHHSEITEDTIATFTGMTLGTVLPRATGYRCTPSSQNWGHYLLGQIIFDCKNSTHFFKTEKIFF